MDVGTSVPANPPSSIEEVIVHGAVRVFKVNPQKYAIVPLCRAEVLAEGRHAAAVRHSHDRCFRVRAADRQP